MMNRLSHFSVISVTPALRALTDNSDDVATTPFVKNQSPPRPGVRLGPKGSRKNSIGMFGLIEPVPAGAPAEERGIRLSPGFAAPRSKAVP